MSIYASLGAPCEDHAESCGIWVESPPGSGCFEFGPERDCTCGLRDAPILYRGSHILPSDDDERGGSVDIALIPDHITRDARDDAPEGAHKWWLRLGVHGADGDGTVVLDRQNVRQIRDTLDWWLNRAGSEEGA